MNEKSYGVKYMTLQADIMKDKDKYRIAKWQILEIPKKAQPLGAVEIVGITNGAFVAILPYSKFYLNSAVFPASHLRVDTLFDNSKVVKACPTAIEEYGKMQYRRVESPDLSEPVYISEDILHRYFYWKDTLDFYISGPKEPVYLMQNSCYRGIILPCNRKGA